MEPRIVLGNQTVVKVQETLDLLPVFSQAVPGSSRPGWSFHSLAGSQPPGVLSQIMGDLADAGGEPVSAQLAILEPSHSGSKFLVPVWSCVFRYKSDPSEFSRLITSQVTPNALELPHFQLASDSRPGRIAVHQPAPAATMPCVRLFARFCEFFETQDSWSLSRFDSDWAVLGGEYFELRIFPKNKRYREGEGLFAGAWTFCSRLREELMGEVEEWPLEKLSLSPSIVKKIRTARPPMVTVKELAELPSRELNDRLNKKLARTELADVQSALRLYGLTLAEDEPE